MGGEAADDELHVLVLDQLLRPLGADGGLELVVAEEHLDLAAQDAVLRVQLFHGQGRAALLVDGERTERARQREREADLDHVLALGPEDRWKAEDRSAGRGRGQKCATVHCRLLSSGVTQIPGTRQAVPGREVERS